MSWPSIRPSALRISSCLFMVFGRRKKGGTCEKPGPANLTRLDAHPFHQGAPVGEPQFSEGTNLEAVIRSRCEVADSGRRFRTGNGYHGPIDNRSSSGNRRIAEVIASGFRDTFDRHDKLPRVALVDRNDDGLRHRLRRSPGYGSCYEPARRKRVHVILAGRLDVVSEEPQHDGHVCASLILLDGYRFAPIESGSDCGIESVDSRFEARHIDWRTRISRITVQSVVHGNGPCDQIGIGHTDKPQLWFDDV